MKIINFNDITALNIPAEVCYDWVSDMIREKKDAILPAKTHISMEDNEFCNIMPSLLCSQGESSIGVKVVTRYPERKPSLDSKIMLLNASTGEFLAMMDGNWITAMRTGAVAAHSIIHFAKNNWETIGMIGLGNVARSSLLVLNFDILTF